MPHGHGGNPATFEFDKRPPLPPTGGRDGSYLSGFPGGGGGGGRRLAGVVEAEFRPELERARGRRGEAERRLDPFLDPAGGARFVTEGAERIASDVLRPGGEVAGAIRGLRGGAIRSGFGTTGADTSRQEAQIISRGLRSSVGSFIGQALPGLYEGAAGRTADLQQQEADRSQDYLESLYTGYAGAESLRLAERRQKIFGIF